MIRHAARISRIVLVGLLLASATATKAASLPGDSVYQLQVPLVDQNAKTFNFASLRGQPRLVTMFYTSCAYMCPLIIDTTRMAERKLDDSQRAKLSVLMVSFDAERDDPAALKAQAEKRKIQSSRWTLARTDAANVRKLAAVLGIQYRQLDDGEFNHSSVLLLLDAEGRIAARSDVMGKIDPDFIAAIKAVLDSN
ncbi:MAG TPA: SCO family protein [Dokdonella sp.]|uniref:SCO family protein n=1 Tax=Dokdonella sp. TaxID=2291710 RepID=UPI002D7E2122|nr:SCO family protein [Dokdonella sp.]HET9034425.1 SCO family protein [Dokdonella sp.]